MVRLVAAAADWTHWNRPDVMREATYNAARVGAGLTREQHIVFGYHASQGRIGLCVHLPSEGCWAALLVGMAQGGVDVVAQAAAAVFVL